MKLSYLPMLLAAGLLAGCGGDSPDSAGTPASTLAPVTTRVQAGTSAAEVTTTVAAPVRFSGKLADYTVVRSGSSFTVTEKAGTKSTVTVQTGALLLFADATVATEADGPAAKVYRLYQAAFDRAPDLPGLGYHISFLEGLGLPLQHIAQGFVDSPEFATKYGQLDNEQFVTRLYNNVLRRAPDAEGLKYYLDLLAGGTVTRPMVLTFFSESPENQRLVASAIANGVIYTPHVVAGGGSASAARGGAAQAFWRADHALDVVLRDARGTPVPGASLQCSAIDPSVLTVSNDCRTVSGLRLGTHEVNVTGGGVSARLAVKVTPQRVALGISGTTQYWGLVTTPAGQVYAWGDNTTRQLGQGHVTDSPFPLAVLSSDGKAALDGIVAASGGWYNGMALAEDGRLYGWGNGMEFARPDGTGPLPVLIRNPANSGELQSIVQVGVGQKNAVALTDDGRVLTWGDFHGQGPFTESPYPNQPRLADRTPLTGMVQISAGLNYGLALSQDGRVYSWGFNNKGRLGRGVDSTSEPYAGPVIRAEDNQPIDNIVAISAGYNFAMALRADGQVYIWGSNDFYQAGQGTQQDEYNRAVLLKNGNNSGPLTNIVMVSAGGIYGLALDDQGRVYSWGNNNHGQLGVGAGRQVGSRTVPGPVIGADGLGQLSGIVSIAAGDDSAYALRRDGAVLAWGKTQSGATGTGVDIAELQVPTQVLGLNGQGKLSLDPAAYPNLLRRGR